MVMNYVRQALRADRLWAVVATLVAASVILASCGTSSPTTGAASSAATGATAGPAAAATTAPAPAATTAPAAVAPTTSPAASLAKTPIKIGVAVGLTGYMSDNDTHYSEGAQLAAKVLNAQGGVDGHEIQLSVVDMQSNAAMDVTVANQLLNQKGIDVLLHGSVSAGTAAIAPIVSNKEVPMIAASVLPSDPTWTFSVLQPVSSTNAIALDFLSKVLHAKKVAVLYSQTPYGQQAAAALGKQAEALGISVPWSQGAATDATDLTPIVQQIQAANVDAVIDTLTGPNHIVFAKDATSSGLKIPVIMGTDARTTFKQATDANPNSYWTGIAAQVYPNNADSAVNTADAALVQAYTQAYGNADRPGLGNAGRGWDSIQMLNIAVHNSGAVTGKALLSALENVAYAGSESEYKYTPRDHTGQVDVPNPLSIAQYQGSTLKVVYPTK